MLLTHKYVHKPVFIDAVQVTVDNIGEVAEWCQGKIIVPRTKPPVDETPIHIKVAVIRPQKVRQTQAFVGDWVLKTRQGFRVYNPDAFKHSYSLAPESDPVALAQLEKVFS